MDVDRFTDMFLKEIIIEWLSNPNEVGALSLHVMLLDHHTSDGVT